MCLKILERLVLWGNCRLNVTWCHIIMVWHHHLLEWKYKILISYQIIITIEFVWIFFVKNRSLMFQFTVIQHTHSLSVRFAFSNDDDVSLFIHNHTWFFIQNHTYHHRCVKHNRTEGQQGRFDLVYILYWEPEESKPLDRCHHIVVEMGRNGANIPFKRDKWLNALYNTKPHELAMIALFRTSNCH